MKSCSPKLRDQFHPSGQFRRLNVIAISSEDTIVRTALRFGKPLPERARQPGADIDQLKRDLFGTFIEVNEPTISDADALTGELRSFVDCVQAGETPLVDGHAALAAMDVADQILNSVADHQWDGHAGGAVGPFGPSTGVDELAA